MRGCERLTAGYFISVFDGYRLPFVGMLFDLKKKEKEEEEEAK